MTSLGLGEAGVLELHNLPDKHKDPFDRMLIRQVRAHGLSLVTTDTDSGISGADVAPGFLAVEVNSR